MIHERNVAVRLRDNLKKIKPKGPVQTKWINQNLPDINKRITDLQGVTGTSGLIFTAQEAIANLKTTTGPGGPVTGLPQEWIQDVLRIGQLSGDENLLIEQADIATRKAGFPTSPGGTDMTLDEINGILGFDQSLLTDYFGEVNITQSLVDAINGATGLNTFQAQWVADHLSDLTDRLTELQGLTGGGGLIFDLQETIAGLQAQGATAGPDQTALNALLLQQLEDAQKRLAVSQAQYPVFAAFSDKYGGAYGGAFKWGGIVPGPMGAPMPILAHGGETVSPAGSDGNVAVHIHGDIHSERSLQDAVEVYVDGKLRRDVSVSRRRAQR